MNHLSSQDDRPRRPLRRTVALALAASVAMVGAAACDRALVNGVESDPERRREGRRSHDHVQLDRRPQERR